MEREAIFIVESAAAVAMADLPMMEPVEEPKQLQMTVKLG